MPTYDASPEAPHSSIELRNIVPSISFGHLAGEGEANNVPSSVEENVIERMKVRRLPMCCISPVVLNLVIWTVILSAASEQCTYSSLARPTHAQCRFACS
jgi:hypothetical protein